MNSAAVRASLGITGRMRLVVTIFQLLESTRIKPWCDDALNGWVICQIEEETHILHTSILLKILLEEPVNAVYEF